MRQFFALHRWAGQNVQRDALEIQEALFKAHFKEFYNVIVTKGLEFFVEIGFVVSIGSSHICYIRDTDIITITLISAIVDVYDNLKLAYGKALDGKGVIPKLVS